jgi:hypothetical protein
MTGDAHWEIYGSFKSCKILGTRTNYSKDHNSQICPKEKYLKLNDENDTFCDKGHSFKLIPIYYQNRRRAYFKIMMENNYRKVVRHTNSDQL